MNIDYSKITDNPKVIELLKQRIEIENKIKAIDETALIKHELELLSLPYFVVPKGTLCCNEGDEIMTEDGSVICKVCKKIIAI
jgi:hypothetical protein